MKEKKEWHPNFIKYMNFIINHPNYKGLPINKKKDGSWSWIESSSTIIRQRRKEWCEQKAKELGIPIEPGVYAKVMLKIHPTKSKVCQICGQEMSLYYHYPSTNFIKAIEKKFDLKFSPNTHINDIWDSLIKNGFSDNEIALFFIKKGKLKLDINTLPEDKIKNKVIDSLEKVCRNHGKKLLSPGAMSNFPDRYDGFHTYNRCCRSTQDKGRSKENLKSYTRDRRAYEYWSDGNIQAANQFMGSDFFHESSADHIGPISLGFIHDPLYIQKMEVNSNSSKRDRLLLCDVEKIINIENKTHICPMSWYSKLIWKYIRENYQTCHEYVFENYHQALKQNMSNFMYILWYIIENCPIKGKLFLEEALLKPKYEYFNYSYKFNSNGEVIKKKRHFTERSLNENNRYKRIAFASVYDYQKKANRNISANLSSKEHKLLDDLCDKINDGYPIQECENNLIMLIETIEKRIISLI